MVKNLPAMQETWVWSLGREDALEKGKATHCSILAWRIPWTEEPGGLQSMGSRRVRHNWTTNTTNRSLHATKVNRWRLNKWTKMEISIILFFNFHFFISWRLITLQYCSGFCHTLTWISHGFTGIPHPDPPSHLPLHPIPLGLPSAPGLSTCLMHPTWAGDLLHPR